MVSEPEAYGRSAVALSVTGGFADGSTSENLSTVNVGPPTTVASTVGASSLFFGSGVLTLRKISTPSAATGAMPHNEAIITVSAMAAPRLPFTMVRLIGS